MDLEAQSLLLDGEDSVDVRPQRRTLPRAAFFVVAVLFVTCLLFGYSGSTAGHERAATTSLRGFMQKARRHTETIQLLFPSHAVTKVVKAQNQTGERKESRNEAHVNMSSATGAQNKSSGRKERLNEAHVNMSSATGAQNKSSGRKERLNEAHVNMSSARGAQNRSGERKERLSEAHVNLNSEKGASTDAVSTTTTRATFTTTEAPHDGLFSYKYTQVEPDLPGVKTHKLAGLGTIVWQIREQEQAMDAAEALHKWMRFK